MQGKICSNQSAKMISTPYVMTVRHLILIDHVYIWFVCVHRAISATKSGVHYFTMLSTDYSSASTIFKEMLSTVHYSVSTQEKNACKGHFGTDLWKNKGQQILM